MSENHMVRDLMKERLTAAESEEEMCRSKEENQRKQELLESVLSPRVVLLRMDVPTSPLSSPEPGLDLDLKQEIPETSQIKEEPEEKCVKEEEEQLPVSVPESSAVCVKTEESTLLQQTEPKEDDKRVENVDICGTVSSPMTAFCSYNERITIVQVIIAPSTSSQSAGSSAAPSEEPVLNENSVSSLQRIPFAKRSFEEQMRVKELGPDRPDLCLQQKTTDRSRSYMRGFSRSAYERRSWLTGCSVRNAFFCFPCLLFSCMGTEITWITSGVNDLRHLSEKCKRHENRGSHLDNCFRLSVFGRTNIAAQLDESYRAAVRKHNEEVTKNRHILSHIIDCVKFCRGFELATGDRDETESSNDPGVFHSLADFVSSPDDVLKRQLEGMSKTIQNELLNCMLSVTRDEIVRQIGDSGFLSIQVDETTDLSARSQLVLVLRYLDGAQQVHERFFTFIQLTSTTAGSIAAALEKQLATILPNEKDKLICQAYDGASVMSGVLRRIQKKYPNAHFIHCYAHQLGLIRRVTWHISEVRVFFSDLCGFDSFFSKSPKCARVLDEVVAQERPTSSNAQWEFHSRAVDTVFENKGELIRCFERIRDSGDFDANTEQEAGALAMLLESPDFSFFLQLFHQIQPHVDVLCFKLQKKDIDSVHIKESIQQFETDLQKIRDSVHSIAEEQSSGSRAEKRRRMLNPEERGRIGEEICDTILKHMRERFSFTEHLISASLLQSNMFEEYSKDFPDLALNFALKAYPALNGSRLKTELGVIYSKEDLRSCRGAIDLLLVFAENNLEEVFQETVKLLKILITTPMATVEAERCFTTTKRIKAFLRNTMNQDILNALAMLSMEKKLITGMWDFNHRVIEKFAAQKERRAKFLYK